MKKTVGLLACLLTTVLIAGCSLAPAEGFPVEDNVDLDRYMGKWYVIAHIPPDQTKNAFNSIERYEQVEPGEIQTVFTYREGGFDGDPEVLRPTGYVIEGTNNAVWGMSFFWPMRLQYVISYVDDAYETTIVARDKRDFVWIMARQPQLDDATYRSLVDRVEEIGYDVSQLRKVPQQPLDARDDG